MEEDPYNNLGNLRARTANEILKAFGHVARLESSLHLPIYAHHGTQDRLADLQVGPPLRAENCTSHFSVLMMSAVPMIDRLLLGLGKANKRRSCGGLWLLPHMLARPGESA